MTNFMTGTPYSSYWECSKCKTTNHVETMELAYGCRCCDNVITRKQMIELGDETHSEFNALVKSAFQCRYDLCFDKILAGVENMDRLERLDAILWACYGNGDSCDKTVVSIAEYLVSEGFALHPRLFVIASQKGQSIVLPDPALGTHNVDCRARHLVEQGGNLPSAIENLPECKETETKSLPTNVDICVYCLRKARKFDAQGYRCACGCTAAEDYKEYEAADELVQARCHHSRSQLKAQAPRPSKTANQVMQASANYRSTLGYDDSGNTVLDEVVRGLMP